MGVVMYAFGKWGADGSVGESRNCRATRVVSVQEMVVRVEVAGKQVSIFFDLILIMTGNSHHPKILKHEEVQLAVVRIRQRFERITIVDRNAMTDRSWLWSKRGKSADHDLRFNQQHTFGNTLPSEI